MKVQHDLLMGCTEEQIKLQAQWDMDRMSQMDAYVSVRGVDNAAEYGDVPPERMGLYNKHYYAPVHLSIRIPKTKWSVTRYPSDAMAQNGSMTLERLEDFYFKATTIDIQRFCQAQAPLQELMSRTDWVKITGPGTHLEFLIKVQDCSYDDGHFNIPCGEFEQHPEMAQFRALSGPRDGVHDRYVVEDAHAGNSLLASLGRAAGIKTPVVDSLLTLASVLNREDFYAGGITLENLGLAGRSIDEINRYLEEGTL